jgi:hypothetical protein
MIDGKVGKAEFDEIAGRLEAHIRAHGKVRLLEEIRGFGGIELAAFWDDLKFSLRHLNDFSRCAVVGDQAWFFSRCAVVGDQAWFAWVAKAVNPFLACEIRCFERARMAEARAWLREEDGPSAGSG